MMNRTSVRIYSWGARALYLGPALNLSAHRNAVALVALGLEGTFDVARDPTNLELGFRKCRSALIMPNTLHQLTGTNGLMAFLYVDPYADDWQHLLDGAEEQLPTLGFDLSQEPQLVEILALLWNNDLTWEQAREKLKMLLAREVIKNADFRVKKALDRIHSDPGGKYSLDQIAVGIGLSASRLRRLIKIETGVPFRRYRLWISMGSAMYDIRQGKSLTVAATNAGFSSPAHFSAAFRDMFGMEPSRLVGI